MNFLTDAANVRAAQQAEKRRELEARHDLMLKVRQDVTEHYAQGDKPPPHIEFVGSSKTKIQVKGEINSIILEAIPGGRFSAEVAGARDNVTVEDLPALGAWLLEKLG